MTDLIPGLSSYDPFQGVDAFVSPHGSSSHGTANAEGVLLLRCLQRACLTSRREAIELIGSGEVLVDNVVERNPFRRVVASHNIKVRGHTQRLRFSPSRIWIYHKPANVIVSRSDPAGRALFTKHAQMLGIDHLIPVGSIPFKSHGILLLTNDGELANFLSHPKANIQQTYHFRITPAIDPVLANKLNAEGVRIHGVPYKKAEFLVNHANRSRYYVKIKIRGETMPMHQLLGHLGRRIQRGGRVSFGPFTLSGLPPGGLREVTVPPFFAQHVADVWKPFIERDWPTFRRDRVRNLQRISRFRELRAKELEEMDAFTFDEFKDALSYDASALAEEADRVAAVLVQQPRVDDATGVDVFLHSNRGGNVPFVGGPFDATPDVFVKDITRAV
jgi:pseudouridine synthase